MKMKDSIGKLVNLLVTTALVFGIGIGICSESVTAQEDWHIYSGDKIQDAVDSASSGDTIYVHAGTYVENIKVNKTLNFVGDGADEVTVKALNTEDHKFHLTADGITITGFTVTDSYLCQYGGICLQGVNNCKIFNNSCRKNLCAGIFLKHSNNCEIIDNNVSNNYGGIKLAHSNNNTVKNNILENNFVINLDIYGGSRDNLIYNNYFSSVGYRGNVIDATGENRWNITKKPGRNILGGQYLGGNYYGGYTGEDLDGDGIGDMPHEIKETTGTKAMNKDYLPLVEAKLDEGQQSKETPGFEFLIVIYGLLMIILSRKRTWKS